MIVQSWTTSTFLICCLFIESKSTDWFVDNKQMFFILSLENEFIFVLPQTQMSHCSTAKLSSF